VAQWKEQESGPVAQRYEMGKDKEVPGGGAAWRTPSLERNKSRPDRCAACHSLHSATLSSWPLGHSPCSATRPLSPLGHSATGPLSLLGHQATVLAWPLNGRAAFVDNPSPDDDIPFTAAHRSQPPVAGAKAPADVSMQGLFCYNLTWP